MIPIKQQLPFGNSQLNLVENWGKNNKIRITDYEQSGDNLATLYVTSPTVLLRSPAIRSGLVQFADPLSCGFLNRS